MLLARRTDGKGVGRVYGQAHRGDVNLYTRPLSPLYNNTHDRALIIGTRVLR